MASFRRTTITAGLAGVFGVILAVITDVIEYPLLFASLASSILLVFNKPEDDASRPQAVVGGHILCGLIGVASHWILSGNMVAASGLSIVLATIVMLQLNIFHPPAAGTAWSFVLYPHDPTVFIGLLGGTLLLSLVTLGGERSLVLQFMLYFYGTPFHKDSPIKSINDIEKILESELKIIEVLPLMNKEVRRKRFIRNEKIRKLMLLILEDEIKDRAEEESLISEIGEIDQWLEDRDSPKLLKLDRKLDQVMEHLQGFIEEFGED